jgi:hypothetical protein
MIAVLASGFVILAVLGLGFYAVHRMRPGSFRLRTSVLRLFSFSMEIESPGMTGKPSGEPKQSLSPAGTDGPATHEALPGD